MDRPGKAGHEIAVAEGPVGRRLDIFSARQSHFRRTGGVGRYPSAADYIGRGEDLRGMADRRDRLIRLGK